MGRGKPKYGRHPNFKTGRTKTNHGYILVFVGQSHHLSDIRGYAYEHRLVAEKKIGRRLKPDEQIHHVDGNKENNHPDNLDICRDFKEHRFKHRLENSNRQIPGQDNPFIKCKCGCGLTFKKFDPSGRPRSYYHGHNPQYSPTEDLILDVLNSGHSTVSDIINKSKKSPGSIKCCLSKMCNRGKIRRIKHGVYGI